MDKSSNVYGGGKLLILSNVIIWVHAKKKGENDLKDYKFHCFDGKVKYFKIDYNRFVKHHANYYDRKGNRISLQEVVNPSDDSFDIQIPSTLQEMVSLANRLSYGFPFLRVDFYEINGKVYFGELTFFPYSGMTKYKPSCWDEKIGQWLNVQKK